jgi:hypothetical protein
MVGEGITNIIRIATIKNRIFRLQPKKSVLMSRHFEQAKQILLPILRFFYFFTGIVPCIWFANALTMLYIAWMRLGVIPRYGNYDPAGLDLDFFSIINLFSTIVGFFCVVVFPVLFGVMMFWKSNRTRRVFMMAILFFISFLGCIAFKTILSPQFDWIYD